MTTTPINAITTIDAYLPSPIAKFVHLFCKVHRFWRGYRRYREISQNATNFGLATAGWIVNFAFGTRKFVKIPARGILIARRVIDCIKAQMQLVNDFQKFIGTFTEETYIEAPKRISLRNIHFLSPSSRHLLESNLNNLIERTIKVFKHMSICLASLFTVSMSYMDLIDALNLKEGDDEAVQDVFLNLKSIIKTLASYKKEVHGILFSLGAKYNIQPITTSAYASLQVVGGAYIAYKKVTHTASKAINLVERNLEIGKYRRSHATFPIKRLPRPKTDLRHYQITHETKKLLTDLSRNW